MSAVSTRALRWLSGALVLGLTLGGGAASAAAATTGSGVVAPRSTKAEPLGTVLEVGTLSSRPTLVTFPLTLTGTTVWRPEGGSLSQGMTLRAGFTTLAGEYRTRALYCANTPWSDPELTLWLEDMAWLTDNYGRPPVAEDGSWRCEVGTDPHAATDELGMFDPAEMGALEPTLFLQVFTFDLANIPFFYMEDLGSGDVQVVSAADVVDVPDAVLAGAVNRVLGQPEGSLILRSQMESLTELTGLSGLGIRDLTGLEAATNLTTLAVYDNEIADLSPLAGLTKLTNLQAYQNAITDVTPLAGLTGLEVLNLYDNAVSDLSPLAGLTAMRDLRVHSNDISDISVLAGMPNLQYLVIADNEISDLSPLAGLTGLTDLYAYGNRITDVTPLAGLTGLRLLALADNGIVDVSSLAGLTRLENLSLRNNHISDLSSLAELAPAKRYYTGQYDLDAGTVFVPQGVVSFRHPLTGVVDVDGTTPRPLAGVGYVTESEMITWSGLATDVTSLPFGYKSDSTFTGTGTYSVVPVVFTHPDPGPGTVGDGYRFTFATTPGFDGSFALVGSGVPGLTLNARTGILEGTPTQAGTFTITVVASDPWGNSLTREDVIVIADAATGATGGTGEQNAATPASGLPLTGWETPTTVIAAGVLLALLGTALVRRRRRA